MRISNQNQRTQVASEKTEEASTTGQVPKGAQKKTAGRGIVGDSFEIAKSPGAFDQLMGRNGTAPLRSQGVDLPPAVANDATGSIRHDDPAVNPSLDGGDPRGNLKPVGLERETVVDVAAATPGGQSLEQTLPTGLDGKPLPTGPRHYLNDQAEKLLRGRGDSNSPLNMQRDPKASFGSAPRDTGRDATKDTLGRATGPGVGGESKAGGGTNATPPPGAELSFRAPNRDLVSDKKDLPKYEPKPETRDARAEWLAEADKKAGKVPDGPLKEFEPPKKMTDPDADLGTGAGTLTEDEVARMVAVGRGDIDVVRGYGGGPQVEGDTPPVRYRDLVTDPGADDPVDVSTVSTSTVTPPGQEISKPINPNDGLGPELPPTGGGTGPSSDGDS
ncbi:MAG: hypothetical protein HYX75_08235 [Acidobacteria bacterium]|nr:hypothetical protein [Acidobacteriota bacterium]